MTYDDWKTTDPSDAEHCGNGHYHCIGCPVGHNHCPGDCDHGREDEESDGAE